MLNQISSEPEFVMEDCYCLVLLFFGSTNKEQIIMKDMEEKNLFWGAPYIEINLLKCLLLYEWCFHDGLKFLLTESLMII